MPNIVTRTGGGLPERTFDGLAAAAEWIVGTGRSDATPGQVAASLTRGGRDGTRYGFHWRSRRRHVTRHGGGLGDRTFDSIRDAARWCRANGLSKAGNDTAACSKIRAACAYRGETYCGFEWEAERVPGDAGGDSPATPPPASSDIRLALGNGIRAGERRVAELERLLEAARRDLEAKRSRLAGLEDADGQTLHRR